MKRIIRITIAIFSIALLSVTAKKDKKENFNKDYVYIPSGTFQFEQKAVSVAAFYMLSTEVTNKQYREFILDLKTQGKESDYLIAAPDTSNWIDTTRNSKINSMKELYFNHPAYANYPVVNITQAGAALYCVWLTKEMRIKYPKLNFNDFRLPSKEEWVYAAKGGLKHSPFPWGGPFTNNAEGKYLANFWRVGENNLTRDSLGNVLVVKGSGYTGRYIGDFSDIIYPVKSYNPNGYGLYNMAGNVSELVGTDTVAMGGSWRSPGFDIQVTSEVSATKSKPTIGFRVVSSFVGR